MKPITQQQHLEEEEKKPKQQTNTFKQQLTAKQINTQNKIGSKFAGEKFGDGTLMKTMVEIHFIAIMKKDSKTYPVLC